MSGKKFAYRFKGGREMKDYFLDFSIIEFECPYCCTEYIDYDDKLYKKIQKNKKFMTSINCENCGERFGVTVDVSGEMIGVKLK
jgi:transcription elongation factor Elf1